MRRSGCCRVPCCLLRCLPYPTTPPLTHLDILPALEDDKVQQLLGRARDGPAVLFMVVDGQAVCLGLLLKAPVVIDPVVAGVLDAGLHAVLVHHLVQQVDAVSSMGRSRVADEILISYLFSPPACQTLEQVI